VTTTMNIPLPIELVFFEAKVVDQVVKLRWITASEQNNDYFTVEKSKDGEVFEEAIVLPGAGTSYARNEYTTEDPYPHFGRSYYRLKQTDYDGTYAYSTIVIVELQLERGGVVALYPNPVENHAMLTIEYEAIEDETLTMVIYDQAGKVVQWKNQQARAGRNTYILQPQFQAGGYYLVRVQGRGRTQTFRLLVE
jgi:hypothetical protein